MKKITDKKISEVCSVTERTIRNWKKTKPGLLRLVSLGIQLESTQKILNETNSILSKPIPSTDFISILDTIASFSKVISFDIECNMCVLCYDGKSIKINSVITTEQHMLLTQIISRIVPTFKIVTSSENFYLFVKDEEAK